MTLQCRLFWFKRRRHCVIYTWEKRKERRVKSHAALHCRVGGRVPAEIPIMLPLTATRRGPAGGKILELFAKQELHSCNPKTPRHPFARKQIIMTHVLWLIILYKPSQLPIGFQWFIMCEELWNAIWGSTLERPFFQIHLEKLTLVNHFTSACSAGFLCSKQTGILELPYKTD